MGVNLYIYIPFGKGERGNEGKSAYEVAFELDNNIGAESVWLESLNGDDGVPFSVDESGDFTGRDTYNGESKGYSYLDAENGNLYIKLSISSGDWSSAIPFGKGEHGDEGKSAYEVAFEIDNNIGDEATWLESLKGNDGISSIPLGISVPYTLQGDYNMYFDSSGLGINTILGWALCNGGNETIDLRCMFIREWGGELNLVAGTTQ